MTPPSPWWHKDRHTDRRPLLLARNRIKDAFRQWFSDQGFLEVEPGALQTSPGNETHLRAFKTELISPAGTRHGMYLHTSPEFACKKLLAAGEPKIFTFSQVFRNAETGPLHTPEFTMLEWYRAGNAGDEQYTQVQKDCAELVALAASSTGNTIWRWKERTCDAHQDSLVKTVPEALAELFGIDFTGTFDAGGEPDRGALAEAARRTGIPVADDETWGDIFSKLMVSLEARYGEIAGVATPDGLERSMVLDLYPACMSPLARLCERFPGLAKRFELFICGIELANGFAESNDPEKVRAGLTKQMNEKERIYGERYPLDHCFLAALPQVPPASAGCAMGFDRLVMLATGATRIDQVQWTPLSR
jgi:elongation factor P--(R)-beta-lysine ligase